MDLKSALNKLKTGGASLTMPFLYCESDSNGKPLVLVGTITPDQKTKALTGARSQKTATGKMSINGQGDLCLQQTKGTALSSLVRGIENAAKNAIVRTLFKEVQMGAAAETVDDSAALKDSPDNNNRLEDDNNNNLASEKKTATSPAPKPAPKSDASEYVDLNTLRNPAPKFPASNYETSPNPPPPARGKADVAPGYSGINVELPKAPVKRPSPAKPPKTAAPAHGYESANMPAPAKQQPAPANPVTKPRKNFPIANYHAENPAKATGETRSSASSAPETDNYLPEGSPEQDTASQRIPPGKEEVDEGGYRKHQHDQLTSAQRARTGSPSSEGDNYLGGGKLNFDGQLGADEVGKTYEETAKKKPGKEEIEDSEPVGKKGKFPDVLRKSPEMAALLGERDSLRQKLEDAQKINALETIADTVAKLDKLQEEIENAQRKLNKTGRVPQPVSEEYRGENEKYGWRAPKPHPFKDDPSWTVEEREEEKRKYADVLKNYEARRDANGFVTAYYTEEERKKSGLSVDADGRLVDPEGNPISGYEEFVMDAESGQMHRFTQHTRIGKQVLDAEGQSLTQTESVHHSSILSGKEVGGAGGIVTEDGVVKRISNSSGHYKPGIGPMMQTMETLLQQGVLLDQKWVDKDGKELEGKVEKLYEEVRALQKRVEQKLKDDPKADVTANRTQIDKSLAMLGKLGAGPINRIRDAKVNFTEVKSTTTGHAVKMKVASSKEMDADKFVTTGGGNKTQAEAKKEVLKQINKRKVGEGERTIREKMDAEHSVTGEGSADHSEEDLDKAISGLEASLPNVAKTSVKPGKEEVSDNNNSNAN